MHIMALPGPWCTFTALFWARAMPIMMFTPGDTATVQASSAMRGLHQPWNWLFWLQTAPWNAFASQGNDAPADQNWQCTMGGSWEGTSGLPTLQEIWVCVGIHNAREQGCLFA